LIFFILLNIFLLYVEYLANINKPEPKYRKTGASDQIKKIAGYLLAGLGGASGYVTLKNEY
jgi:hypothetical protein